MRSIILSGCLVALVGCVGPIGVGPGPDGKLAARQAPAPAARGDVEVLNAANYPNWEYTCTMVDRPSQLGDVLSDAGSKGWELAGFAYGNMACFKRPVAIP